jgi:hypothetical protein
MHGANYDDDVNLRLWLQYFCTNLSKKYYNRLTLLKERFYGNDMYSINAKAMVSIEAKKKKKMWAYCT